MEPSNWQIGLSTIKDRTKYALNNSLFCDVKFSVVDSDGDQVILSAHKFVLAITSPVFESMFYGRLAETKQPINLPDITKEAFEELLRFAYSDQVNLTGSSVMEVLYLADKYMIPALAESCREYFKRKVRPQNVFRVLPQVSKMSDKIFEEMCWDVIDKETQPTVSSSSFCDITHELLLQVLCRDSLRIKEVTLFQAVERWASKRIEEKGLDSNGETKRTVLGEDVIRLIRFPLMTLKEFAEAVLPSGILQMKEVTEVIQYFSNLQGVTMYFSKKDRQAQYRLLFPTNQFTSVDTKTFAVSRIFTVVDFNVNKTVSLWGVRLFSQPGCSYSVDVIIVLLKNGKCEGEMKKLHSAIKRYETEEDKIDDLYYGFTVPLEEPFKLSAGVDHRIAVVIYDECKAYSASKFEYGYDVRDVVYCEDLKVTHLDYHTNPLYLNMKKVNKIDQVSKGCAVLSFIFRNL